MTDFTPTLSDYPYQVQIASRWQDNDQYGHINNVVYYGFFDTAVNKFLIEQAKLDVQNSDVVAYVASSQCQYMSPASYPEDIWVGLRAVKMGRSSVTYGLSIYAGKEQRRVAHGQFVHVFVERKSGRAISIPDSVREALNGIEGVF